MIKDLNDGLESPFVLKVSFNKLIQHYEEIADDEDAIVMQKAKQILEIAKEKPYLRTGFSDLKRIEENKKDIRFILSDAFSPILTKNEIKTASIPFHNLIFNSSERFKTILRAAGDNFDLEIKNMQGHDTYIMGCAFILNACYGYNINFKRPFHYEIPDANGIMRYYKILYNADFTEIIPNDDAPKITRADYEELLDNFENFELWKEKFPPNSYTFKGFVVSNIFDVTDDQSISNLKSNLIAEGKRKDAGFMKDLQDTFQSLLNLNGVKVGFSTYHKDEDTFHRVYGEGITSYLLNGSDKKNCHKALCSVSYNTLLEKKQFYTVADVDKYYELSEGKAPQYKALKEQGFKSAILAPIANETELLGILELVSEEPYILNSINANKLVDVMPFILMAVERSKREEEHFIEALIQQECTSIHPSVYWKFEQEARIFLKEQLKGNQASFNKIAFKNVYPLFGQIDIKGSSMARNTATRKDLVLQLTEVKSIFKLARKFEDLPYYDQLTFQIDNYLKELKTNFQVDSEQQITNFLGSEIKTILKHLRNKEQLKVKIDNYFGSLHKKVNSLYHHRKDYDETISKINKKMALILDKKQEEAQRMYPHFFERFKTDGVEHNMYIGESITREESFNPVYLYNLRLWQLQIMCEMENVYYQKQKEFPIKLDVASMILVFSQPLSISFRMDEKQFDVDGTYNARYEIVKKRVDKAFIKGTKERVTQKGKLTIIYSHKQDEIEYLNYIKFLQSKRYIGDNVEIVELQDLQAVTGLKAIRVDILYHDKNDDKSYYTYDDLM
ncbi:MAG: GAF domain-containing protein, partial [Winogradskyella sp.]|nr:GAF domain-containing protein [Winogradskyella sp.]